MNQFTESYKIDHNKQKCRNAEITACWSEGEMSHGILYEFGGWNGQHDVPGHEPYGASVPFKKRMRIVI